MRSSGDWTAQPGAADEKSPPFRGHEGPVYAAAFSPDGHRVATAGYDKRVLVWEPDKLREFEFDRVIFNESLPAERQAEVRPRHASAVSGTGGAYGGRAQRGVRSMRETAL